MALLTGRGTFRVEKRKTICDNNLHEVINAWDIVMKPVEFIKDRIKAGRYTFTREEVASACRKDSAVLSSALA